jgi:tRNA (guanine-N7-)-methyltransferase
MRARFNPKAKQELAECNFYIKDKENLQEMLSKKENLNKKIHLEIGMGKGDFISNMAKFDSENIYIGVELSESILSIAIKKIARFKEASEVELNNLYVMSFDAENIEEIFKASQVDKIFLNFSDPWPKSRHEKRRLTYKSFLEKYKTILRENGIIEFKTDNRGLFEFSLVSMQNFGMTFIQVYLDLHKTEVFNVVTEYEEKFAPKGPIYKLIAKF